MADILDTIWNGDRLKRREEARLIESFLGNESRTLTRMGRKQAFVLALDAQYGEGKSWFLARLRQQLEINHPVAFIDAWIDDGNNEPLVSIMAALDEALQPFIKKKKVREKLGDLTRAALPIIAKTAVGVGGKFVARYAGEHISDDLLDAISSAKSNKAPKEDKKEEDGFVSSFIEGASEGVSEIVDNAGKAMLEQYRSRQRSRESFRKNLCQLAEYIEETDRDHRHSPILVIIDELDRCRPDYAIKLLEEVKHLFDVPGLTFIIALHEQQLEASVKAVYGNDFDARSYLRRFFNRHYKLRKLSIKELVVEHFAYIPKDARFSCPKVYLEHEVVNTSASDIAGALLSEWAVTPREAILILDGLRAFVSCWDYPNLPIELPLALKMIMDLVKGNSPSIDKFPADAKHAEIIFASYAPHAPYEQQGRAKARFSKVVEIYQIALQSNVAQLTTSNYRNGGMHPYLNEIGHFEFVHRWGGDMNKAAAPLTWSEYPSRVQEVGRFLDGDSDSV